jgi:hypothetical protein
MTKSLELSAIRIDGDTQPREQIDQATVDEYAEAMRGLARFPPVVVYHDGVNTWLADGFHRYHAAAKMGASALDVEWRVGTLEQAKLYAACANATHGLRRTDGDKCRAIKMVRSTEEGRRWPQKQVAEHCGVSQSYVSRIIGYDSSIGQKSTQPPEKTKAEQKRGDITAAIVATPAASNSAIGRRLGVDRKTVAAVRARAPAPSGGPKEEKGAAHSASPPSAGGYSCAEAGRTAHAALEALRGTRAALTDNDWKRLVGEIGAIP